MATKSKPTYIRNIIGYIPQENSFEKVDQDDRQTVPDDSYTVKELVIRFANGMDLSSLTRNAYNFPGEVDFNSADLEKMEKADVYEREQYQIMLTQKIEESKKLIDKYNKQQAAIKAIADKEAAEEKLLLRKQLRSRKGTPRKEADASAGGEGGARDDDND